MAKSIRVNLDKGVLERLIREVPERAEQVVQKLAQDTEGIAKNNMSTNSPSSPGSPPAVVTGTLKNNIIARPYGPFRWAVDVEALYGLHLEYGAPRRNLAARPFLLPAVKKVIRNAPSALKAVIEDK